MALIYWGEVDAASDMTMATVTNTSNSRFRAALIDLLETIAAGIIADDPTIIAAAEAAVAGALDDANILLGTELSAVRTLDVVDELYAEVRLSFDFRRIGGTLIGGGEVGVNPGAAESAIATGSDIVLLTRDYRRARTDARADGWKDEATGGGSLDTAFTTLASWGDSMTTNQGDIGVALALELARELGVTGYDLGVSSDTLTQVAWRFGGLAVTVHFAASIGELPASGAVPVTVLPQTGWSVASRVQSCVIHDVTGEAVPVTLTQTGAGVGVTPTWTLAQSGIAPIARQVFTGTRIAHTEALDKTFQVTPTIVWAGRNDLDLTRGERAVRAVLNSSRDPLQRILFRSVFNKINEPSGSAGYDEVIAYNEMIRDVVGEARYLDSRRLLIDHGLEVAGLTPTPADVTAISEDRIPDTFMRDTTHLTGPGRLAQARLDAIEIKARNW